MLLEAFREHDLDYWTPKLLASTGRRLRDRRDVSEEGLDHPQIVHNGDVDHDRRPGLGPVRQVGPLAHFSTTRRCHRLARRRRWARRRTNRSPRCTTRTRDGSGSVPPFAGRHDRGVRLLLRDAVRRHACRPRSARASSSSRTANGDPHRTSFGPEVATNKTTAGKESISIDLRTARGARGRAAHLSPSADVFVTGFRSGRRRAARAGLRGAARAEPAAGLRPRRRLRHRRPLCPPRPLRPGRAGRGGQLRAPGGLLVRTRTEHSTCR